MTLVVKMNEMQKQIKANFPTGVKLAQMNAGLMSRRNSSVNTYAPKHVVSKIAGMIRFMC
jgi:hypothetical protein